MLENTNSIGVLAMAAGGVAGLAMLAGIAVSLWKARSLVHKEFFSYFLSPIAYAVLVVFLGVQGWLVAGTLDLLLASGPRGVEWPLQFWLSSPVFWLVFLAACPLLTMRTFAEEKASGTLEMLMTSPLSDWQIVLAKYAGCLLFYTVLWLPTVVYLPVLGGVNVSWAGGLPHVVATADLAPVYTTYLGLFLAGAMFLAMGVCVSSMVRDQLVAGEGLYATIDQTGSVLAPAPPDFWRCTSACAFDMNGANVALASEVDLRVVDGTTRQTLFSMPWGDSAITDVDIRGNWLSYYASPLGDSDATVRVFDYTTGVGFAFQGWSSAHFSRTP